MLSHEVIANEIFSGSVAKAADMHGLSNEDKRVLAAPERELTVHFEVPLDDKLQFLTGYRVLHNSARGPGKGGTRFHPEVTLSEVRRLAAWMTWKTALANIPFGGAKGGVAVDPKGLSEDELRNVTYRYTKEIAGVIGPHTDIPAPDIGTNPIIMEWMLRAYAEARPDYRVKDLYGVVTGKPIEIGGLQGRVKATGFGVAEIARFALAKRGIPIDKAKAVVQGFGNVGMWTTSFLNEMNTTIVGVSDEYGGLYNANGLDIASLINYKLNTGTLRGYPDLRSELSTEILEAPCDILIPAALEDQITKNNAHLIQASIIAEGANGPSTPEADVILYERGRYVIPDILTNVAGVVASYFEWLQNLAGEGVQFTEDQVFTKIRGIMSAAFENLWSLNQTQNCDLRKTAYYIALRRVIKAEEQKRKRENRYY